jgi:hypothetical protein
LQNEFINGQMDDKMSENSKVYRERRGGNVCFFKLMLTWRISTRRKTNFPLDRSINRITFAMESKRVEGHKSNLSVHRLFKIHVSEIINPRHPPFVVAIRLGNEQKRRISDQTNKNRLAFYAIAFSCFIAFSNVFDFVYNRSVVPSSYVGSVQFLHSITKAHTRPVGGFTVCFGFSWKTVEFSNYFPKNLKSRWNSIKKVSNSEFCELRCNKMPEKC